MIELTLPLLSLIQTEPPLAEQFETPFHTTVELYAESPLFYNPTAIDIDDDGNLWVAEAVNYRQWNGRNPGRHHDDGDRIVVLRDTNGDGKANESIIFAQDKDLVSPLGILVQDDRVLVSCSPHLIEYRDTDGDFVADEREILLTGFGGHNHDHGLHSLVEDGQGNLLWSLGNAGPHVIKGNDGFTIRSGSSYNGGGEFHTGNIAGLTSDDGRQWTGGLIGRMKQDGTGLEVLAHNFRNQYEVAIDQYGNMYTADNDDDGNESCRTVAVVDGGNYGYMSEDGTRFWKADMRVGQNIQSAHWHQRDPGVMPHGTINGSGGPTGVTVYEHVANPALYGRVLNADAGRGIVYAHRPFIEGAELSLERGTLIESNRDLERGTWFRPSDVAVGRDGEVYVADWFDPGVGGHYAGDREAYGRILKLSGNAIDARFPDASPAMQKVARLRKGVQHYQLPQYASDASPFIRANCAIAIQHLESDARLPLLSTIASLTPIDDRTYIESVGIGARGLEQELFTELYLNSELDENVLLQYAWRLRPPNSLDFLKQYALNESNDYGLRRLAIDGIAFMRSEVAAETMMAIALLGPSDSTHYAEWWLEQRATNDWSSYGISTGSDEQLKHAKELYVSKVFTPQNDAIEQVNVDVTNGEMLWLLVSDLGNGNSNDWATWINPEIMLEDGSAIDLTTIEWLSADTDWGSVRCNKNCEGSDIMIDGEHITNAIGTHANSLIAFRLPEGATTFTCSIGSDDLGSGLAHAQTSITFKVLASIKRDEAHIQALKSKALEGDKHAQLELLQSQEGSLFLIEEVSVDEQVAEQLRTHPDLAIRAYFDNAFAQSVPDSIHSLTGNPARGQSLFTGKGTCISCHTYNGLGTSTGPELTSIKNKHNADSIYTAIYDPQAAIAVGYENWIVTLKNGTQLLGTLLADGEVVIIKDNEGDRHAIASDDIESLKESPRSLMTSANALNLTPQEVADITAFLLEEQQPRVVNEIDLLQHGLDSFAFTLPDGTNPNDVWSIRNGILTCQGTPYGYLYTKAHYTDFILELDWRGNPEYGPGNSGVLLRVQEPHKVWPKSIEAQLMSKNAGDIWNIDAFPMVTSEDRTSGRRTQKLLPTNEKPLGEWNHYKISLIGGELTLEINGDIQNTATWCERIPGAIALQSEGAVIEFKNITLKVLE